jgi:hypothetical protein
VSATVRPPWNERLRVGSQTKSASTPLLLTTGTGVTTNTSPVKVFSWKLVKRCEKTVAFRIKVRCRSVDFTPSS